MLLSFGLQAGTLKVQDKLKSYQLDYSEDKIWIKASDLNVMLEKNSCNQEIIQRFNHQMKKIFTNSPMLVGKKDLALHYHLDGKDFYEPTQSTRAQQLRLLPVEVRRIKMEELLLCKKKN